MRNGSYRRGDKAPAKAISRRRFLGGLAAGVGLGAAGVAAWPRPGDESAAVLPVPTPAPAAPDASTTSSTLPPTTASTTTTTTTSTSEVPVDPAIVIPIICKEAWGGQDPTGEFTTHRIEHVTVHHTAVLLEDNADAPARARQHQAYHQGRGWVDLAYHFLIDAAGNVYAGRPIEAVGDTGTDYDPTGHLLVCCEGNFDEQEIPAEQYETLVRLVAWGCREFVVDPSSVRGHRDVAATSCPGDDLYSLISDMTLAADVLAAGTAVYRLESVCGPAGNTLVAGIEAGL